MNLNKISVPCGRQGQQNQPLGGSKAGLKNLGRNILQRKFHMMQHVDPWIFSSTSSTMHGPIAQGITLQKKLLMRLLHLYRKFS
jgi:hypothetical protein